MLPAQTPAPAKDAAATTATGPLIVDVHPAPYRSKIYYTTNIGNQRYDMRDSTLLDMITLAYDRDVSPWRSWGLVQRFPSPQRCPR